MPTSVYQQALADLEPDETLAVEDAFAAWATDDTLGQIRQNVADETALAAIDFAGLLRAFAEQLVSGNPPMGSWLTACRAHKLKGRQVPNADCPAVLGRAKGLEDHATAMARASRGRGDLTKEQARKLLIKHSGSPNPVGFESFLRDAPLGSYLVWAIFNPDDPHASPFDRLPHSHEAIRTALGLGRCTPADTLIVLFWSHVDSGSPPLHRPSVADAEDYSYYRPRPDADALWGLTEPLPPNPDGLQPQPEVVMPDTTSQGLRFPFRVVHA